MAFPITKQLRSEEYCNLEGISQLLNPKGRFNKESDSLIGAESRLFFVKDWIDADQVGVAGIIQLQMN